MHKVSLNADTHEYTVDGVRFAGVTKILQGAGFIDLALVRQDVLEAAQKFGIAVHRACELDDKNDLAIDILDPHLMPYLEGWRKFKRDYDVVFEEDDIEKIVYSMRWKFAGTLDREGIVKRKETIIDIKSTRGIPPSTAIQLAGYQIAWEEMTGLKIRQRWCVRLTPGGYKIEQYKSETDKSVFLSALTVYNWRKGKGLFKKCLKEFI